MVQEDVEKGRVCAILSYFLVGIIWYFADENMRKNTYAKFHAKQGLVLLVAWVVLWIVEMVLFAIPFIGWLFLIVVWLASIGLFILWLIGLINAINGKEKEIPIIGQFAKNFTF